MTLKFKRLIALALVICTLAIASPVQAATTQWTIGGTTSIYWASTADSRSDDADLQKQIQLFAQELQAKNLGTCAVKFGPLNQAATSDIILYLDSNLTDIPAQGYRIEVGSNVKISASDADGLFYGCRYVLQHLLTKDGLETGKTYTDSPLVLERGVTLDCGRKYYTKDWIIYLIREMSWYNMNALTLHFSEDMGIRLEHPYEEYSWLPGSDNDLCPQNGRTETYIKNGIYYENATYECQDADEGAYLTIDELKEIIAVADLYHVEIIPSFDSPGHMTYAIEKYYAKYNVDLGAHITNADGTTTPTDNNPVGTSYSIDLSNPEAIYFAKNVIKGYAELFYNLGCRKFDMGGDELLGGNSRWSKLPTWEAYAQEQTKNPDATAYDAFILYLNDLTKMLVDEIGYESVRMWNDMLYLSEYVAQTVDLDTRIQVNFWKNISGKSVYTYMDKGHDVYNYYNDYNYFVLKGNGVYWLANYNEIYEHYTPYVFKATAVSGSNPYDALDSMVWSSNDVVVTGDYVNQVAGSAFCIWSDIPDFYTQDEVMTYALNSIRAHAVKAWGVDSVNINAFVTTLNTLAFCPGKSGDYGPSALPAAATVTNVVDMSALYAAYDQTITEENYTTSSLKAYYEAKENAEIVMNSPNVTQTQINAAVNQMNSALVLRGDPTGLQNAVNAYSTVNSENYTQASYQRYTDAVNAAQTLLNQDGSDISVETYGAAENAVKDAKIALVDVSNLKAAIAQYDSTEGSNYTTSSFASYTAAVDAGKALLGTDQDPTQAQIDNAVAAINSAKNALLLDDGSCEIITAGFRTTRVRIGGKAVICLTLSKEAQNYTVKDSSGNTLSFEVVQYAEMEADGTVVRYLVFTLPEGNIGSRTFTVTVDNGDTVTCTLRAWRAAQ